MPALRMPPLNNTWVGQARPLGPRRTAPCSEVAACWRRKRARCRVMAGSAAYGRPISCNPARRWRSGMSLLGHGRQESLAQNAIDVVAVQRGFDGAAHQAAAFAENRHRLLAKLGAGLQQLFLRDAAVAPECLELPAVDARAFLRQPLRNRARQRQVDVIAAQQNVLAHGHAIEGEFALALGDRDQGEVGSAAADIHHQDQIAHLHALAPVGVAFDPGIERGLRLFEQGEIPVAGLLGGFERQLARHRIERSRHRYQHLLLGERSLRHVRVPSLAQVLQIAAAGLDRRNFIDSFRSAERHQRRRAVHAGMR